MRLSLLPPWVLPLAAALAGAISAGWVTYEIASRRTDAARLDLKNYELAASKAQLAHLATDAQIARDIEARYAPRVATIDTLARNVSDIGRRLRLCQSAPGGVPPVAGQPPAGDSAAKGTDDQPGRDEPAVQRVVAAAVAAAERADRAATKLNALIDWHAAHDSVKP